MKRFDKTKRHIFCCVMSATRWRGAFTRHRRGRYERLRRIVPTVHTLRTDINILYRNALTLQQANESEDHVYSRIFKTVARNSFALHTWSRMLADDPDFLLSAPWWELSHCGRSQLTPVRGNLSLLCTRPEFVFNDAFPLSQEIDTLLGQTALKARRIDNGLMCLRLLVPYRDDNRTQAIVPQLLARILRVELSANWRARVQLHVDQHIAQMPPVLYRERTISSLLSFVASDLRREPDDEDLEKRPMLLMHLTVYSTPDGAAFCLTVADYHLLSPIWHEWQQNAHYKDLLKLGGTLEPLTWDDGYGQGVIVRLPWAKGQH